MNRDCLLLCRRRLPRPAASKTSTVRFGSGSADGLESLNGGLQTDPAVGSGVLAPHGLAGRSNLKAVARAIYATGRAPPIPVLCFHISGHSSTQRVRARLQPRKRAAIPTIVGPMLRTKILRMGGRQDIRFCTSADGASLAVATVGQGLPLVRAATWLTHVKKDADNLCNRHWVAELSRDHYYVRYDSRGCGLSDRDVERFSLGAWIEDLEAVTDALQLERFSLLGMSQGAAIAVGYAALHPERVSHLAIYGGCARGLLKRNPSPKMVDAAQAMLKAAEVGWGADSSSFRQVFISQLFHDASAEQQRAFDEAQRLTISGANAARFMKVVFEIDIREVAPKVRCPTLVCHATDDPCFPFEEGRLLASLIPGARLVPLPSKNHIPFETERAWPLFLSELRAFLPGSQQAVDAGIFRLTARQLEVLREVGRGQTDKQIARKLSLSPRTVEMHVARSLAALKCRTRAEAVKRATDLKLFG